MRIAVLTKFFAISIIMLGLGFSLGAQEGAAEPATFEKVTSGSSGKVVILDLGLLGRSLQAYEIERVTEGPPEGVPHYLEVEGITIGLSLGILDREQQVIEVHLFRAAGEPLAQLLIEPGVTGYADYDDATTVVVELRAIR